MGTRALSGMVQGSPVTQDELSKRQNLDRAAVCFLSRMFQEITNDDTSTVPVYLRQVLRLGRTGSDWLSRHHNMQPPMLRHCWPRFRHRLTP